MSHRPFPSLTDHLIGLAIFALCVVAVVPVIRFLEG
jgi:hypothetical protein